MEKAVKCVEDINSNYMVCECRVDRKLYGVENLGIVIEDILLGYRGLNRITKFYSGAAGVSKDETLDAKIRKASILKVYTDKGKHVLKYLECSNPNGKFINFCGLSVNTESLLIGMGMNLDTNKYIAVLSFKDFLNNIIFSECNDKTLSYDDFIYIIENLKIYSEKFDVLETIKSIVQEGNTEEPEFGSVILNCVNKFRKDREGLHKFSNRFKSNENFMMDLVNSCIELSSNLEKVSFSLFKNLIAEDDTRESVSVTCKHEIEVLMDRSSSGHSLEALRIKYVGAGMSTLFLDSCISYGIGKNRRKTLISEVYGSSGVALGVSGCIFTILSSLVYTEVYSSSGIISGVDMKKSICYNIFDIIRSTGWEQDMIFAYEFEHNYKNDIMVKSILKKFDLENILGNLGITKEEFRESVINYCSRFINLLDCGSMYSRRVRMGQYQLSSFSGVMIRNSGKVFDRMAKRMLKRLG